MPFVEFDKSAAVASPHPRVSIQKGGMFSFNRAAFDLMGGPEAVVLLFDADTERVAFRPTEAKRARSFPVRPQGKNGATFMVAGRLFAKHHGLDTSEARRYEPTMEDGLLIVDLRGEYEVVSGPRTATKAGSGEGDE